MLAETLDCFARARNDGSLIYTLDHEPSHVHVIGSGQAKINLLGPGGMPEIVFSVGIKRPEMRRLLVETTARREEFIHEWERIHARRV